MDLRGWLLHPPKPASLRVKVGKEVHPFDVRRDQTWAELAKSVLALEPDVIEALDSQGKMLRACRPADEFETDDDAATPAPPPSSAATDDPETVRFKLFAELLAGAYKHANEVAFARMVDLFGAVNRRSEALERSLDSTYKLLRRAWEDQAVQGQENQPDAVTRIIDAFTGGQAMAEAEQTNGHNPPNGKGES